jgi:hypothetical protein
MPRVASGDLGSGTSQDFSENTIQARSAAPPSFADPGGRQSHRVRAGILIGAGAGFILGLVPLIASTIFGGILGGLAVKAMDLRFDRGRMPGLHFEKRDA